MLKTNDLDIGYNEPLLEPLTMAILKQEKVAITGKNGIGKSTFIKTVMGLIPALGGSFSWIDTAKIAYFAQDEKFEDGLTPFKSFIIDINILQKKM